MTHVIDSSALLAFIKDEPGADVVGGYLPHALVSVVNYAETLGKAAFLGFDIQLADGLLLASGLRIEGVNLAMARHVAALAPLGRARISLADRFCLALAIELNLPVVTGDRPWASLGLPVQIELFR